MKLNSNLMALSFMALAAPALAGNPAPAPVPPPIASVAMFDWSGWYGGVNLGYGSGSYDQGVSAVNEDGPTVDVDGAMLGLQFGRNFQNGNKVYGFDLGVSSGIDGIVPQGAPLSTMWSCNTGDCNIDIKALVTLRGRYGVTSASGATLFYGAAGLAGARYEGGINNSVQQGDTETNFGYTVGIGIEHMTRPNMSIFAEANYVDLGDLDFGRGGAPGEVYDGQGDFATVKLGINFHF
ncbi:MAG: hypothetical protein CSA68_09640 [Rhodobacterales bacterium]|nr:MAG: hypothetical protein CSA68_09640 [Rhodobacterales bacterium]